MTAPSLTQAIQSEIRRLEAEMEQIRREAKKCDGNEWELEVQLRSRHIRINELNEHLKSLQPNGRVVQ